jgi:outer membrane protein assembly factor BamB
MKSLLVTIYFCVFFSSDIFAQLLPESIKITTTSIGKSAISINTISAKTFNLDYPLFAYKLDTLSDQIIFSARQTSDAGSQYFSRGIFASLSCKKDSVKWLNESSLYDINISGNNLLLSNDIKTVKYNKLYGYDEFKYPSKIIYTFPQQNRGLIYSRTEDDILNCINLSTGNVSWSATIPKKADWVDTQFFNDSNLLIAASGIHAVNIKKGLLWSYPLVTSVTTNKSLIYSSAKHNTIHKISTAIRTSSEENVITQLASNILKDEKHIYFAGKEKMIALNHDGGIAWEIDLRNYPVSKMLISKTDSSFTLVNFGMAMHGDNFIIWGKPFILSIDPMSGKILNQFDLSNIENLVDFIKTDKSLIFAGKGVILEAKPGVSNLNTVLSLSGNKYGEFTEFINGDEYYTFKEGHFVPLNFINDNLIYFKTDNNKIYGIDGENLKYEYHFTELYQFDKKIQDKTILKSQDKTLITSSNFELLFILNTTDNSIFYKNKLYFFNDRKIHVLNMSDLK